MTLHVTPEARAIYDDAMDAEPARRQVDWVVVAAWVVAGSLSVLVLVALWLAAMAVGRWLGSL